MLQSRVPAHPNIQNHINIEDASLNGLPLLDFVFEENNRTEQPYSTIKLPGPGGTTVYGPLSAFNSLAVGEYEEAEQFYYQFADNPTHECLANLAATLYRAANTPYFTYDQHKGRYIAYDAAPLLPAFIKMQPWELYTIFIWYIGCKNELPKIFPTVYEGGTAAGTPDPMIFTKCIHSDSNPKNGTREQIRIMPLKEYFFDMEMQAKKVKELNEQYAKR